MDKKIYLIFIVIVGSFFSFDVSGQTRCPVGVQAGSAQCLPDEEGSAPARPTGEWIKTWGAIVLSAKGQEGWSSSGKLTEDAARQDALNKCHAVGVTDCIVQMTYFNQCVAMAGSSQVSGANFNTGKDEAVASQRALDDCRKKTGSQCTVKFAECTDPIFKKY